MPEPTIPTTCPTCGGPGYLGEELCSTCYGGGSIPLRGVDRHIAKLIVDTKIAAALAVTKANTLESKVDTCISDLAYIHGKVTAIWNQVKPGGDP
ncbi:MAG: hypothetical protein U1C57_01955 [Candidatus Doudnabacteria bacterium]|nr:hypothetical protein [Desulfobacterales bacterium]MDZ4243848.1 hypothetical protein [Candidatus Doudnabacteria bacterium]